MQVPCVRACSPKSPASTTLNSYRLGVCSSSPLQQAVALSLFLPGSGTMVHSPRLERGWQSVVPKVLLVGAWLLDVPPCTHYKSMYRRARTTSPVHTCPCSWWGRDGNGGESLGDFLGPTVMPSIATCLPSANLPVIALHSSPSSPASCKSLDPRFACPHRLASACLGLLTTHLLNSPCSILIYST